MSLAKVRNFSLDPARAVVSRHRPLTWVIARWARPVHPCGMNEAIQSARNERVTPPELSRPFPFASATQAARHAMFEAASRVLTYHASRLKSRVNDEKKALHMLEGGELEVH